VCERARGNDETECLGMILAPRFSLLPQPPGYEDIAAVRL